MQPPGLSCSQLRLLRVHQTFAPPPTQLELYSKMGAPDDILRYVPLSGKAFGEKYMELVAREFFNMEKKDSSTHDHRKCGRTIEQKSARYYANGDDWRWQHIEMTHDWDALMVTGLDFDCIRFYIASRDTVIQLIAKGIICGQGKQDDNGVAAAQQAFWFSRSDFKKKNMVFTDYFLEISTEADLCNWLDAISTPPIHAIME